MNLTAIKKVVMAAILLPFLFMILGSIVIVRTSYSQYGALDADRGYASLLSQAGSLAATLIPDEARMTLAYLTDRSGENELAMKSARTTVEQARQEFYIALADNGISGEELSGPLEAWRESYENIVAFRAAVDSSKAEIRGILPAYQHSVVAQLQVVDLLATRITDKVLLHKSWEFFSILTMHQGAIVTSFLVRRGLMENGLNVEDRGQLAAAQAMYHSGASQLRYRVKTPILQEILRFEKSDTSAKIERFSQAAIANIQPTTGGLVKEWDRLQHERFTFWRKKIGDEIADIRSAGNDLASRARWHLSLIIGLSSVLLLLVAVVIGLAVHGINLVEKLRGEREKLIEELRSAAQTDLLTGLYNRRGFDVAAAALFGASRGSRSVSIILFDLDHFKQVNDRYGHDAGDAVLREIAFIARRHFRSFDLLVRHGGEEFLALLPDTTLEEAAEIAEHVREDIEAAEIQLPGGNMLKITASFGCAARDETSADRGLERLIKRSDLALYAAKHSGRNRVVTDVFVPDQLGETQMRKKA